MKLMLSVLVAAILASGCAHVYPRPANPAYQKVGNLWYCYGNDTWVWGAGKTYRDDPCRIDICELHGDDASKLECHQ